MSLPNIAFNLILFSSLRQILFFFLEPINCRPVLIERKQDGNQNLVIMRVLQAVFKRLDIFELDEGFSAQHMVNTVITLLLLSS